MSSFTNIEVLEANRLSSEEAKGGNNENPAQWTNKLGSGVQINVGDEIQVNSAFISEDGAGDQVIEFKGTQLNATKNIKYISASGLTPNGAFPMGYEYTDWVEEDVAIDLQDNKASMVIKFYKNANGENYVQLPRKFSCEGSVYHATDNSDMWFASENSSNLGADTSTSAYGIYGGLPWHQVAYFGTRYGSKSATTLYYVEDDYYHLAGSIREITGSSNNGAPPYSDFFKIKNDNSRFGIFVSTFAYWNGSDGVGTLIPPDGYWVKEPSDIEYFEYKERIDIEINAGFNTPSNVASDITNQFRKTGEQQFITWDSGDPASANGSAMIPEKRITTYLETPFYKTFVGSHAGDFNSDNYDTWASYSPGTAPVQLTIDWINVHNLIGVKRPDLFLKGRLVNNNVTTLNGSYGIGEVVTSYTALSTYIETDIQWTTHNLELFRDLFISQYNYPELYINRNNDYGNGNRLQTTRDNSRFIHIAPASNTQNLGTDDISGSANYFNDRNQNNITVPLFFQYTPSASLTLSDGNAGSDGCFGAMYKFSSGGSDYIRFFTGASGSNTLSVPDEYLEFNDTTGSGTNIAIGTKIGWDRHFTAFSTCCIAITDGHVKSPWRISDNGAKLDALWTQGEINPSKKNVPTEAAAPYNYLTQLRRIYMGANQPQMNFDTVSNRFTISQLHTPEYIGSPADAGGGDYSGSETVYTVDVNTDANKQVYKLNKRQSNNNWTTALIPYTNTVVASASESRADEPYNLDLLNYNYSPWSIFDSQTGIIIEDFGFSEATWTNGLWGILGFTYNQFNSPLSQTSDISQRITEQNSKLLPFAITNADVGGGDAINFSINYWGVPMYDLQLPTPFLWNGSGTAFSGSAQTVGGTREDFTIQNYPPITEVQESIGLVATNLPRKMLKPYYCVRSDIIDTTHYLGGGDSGLPLPVVAVVNKVNGYGDFYFSDNPSNLVFTATKKKTITSITTSIHYPDQTYARVNDSCAIIYKITKQQPAETDIVSELLNSKKS